MAAHGLQPVALLAALVLGIQEPVAQQGYHS
jgi:hypothetical protein